MKHELERVRLWASRQLQNGAVPEWSWQQHVALIEAVDSILHDMAVRSAVPAAETNRRANHLRLVRDAAARALTELSLEVTEPERYQYAAKVYPLRSRAGNLH